MNRFFIISTNCFTKSGLKAFNRNYMVFCVHIYIVIIEWTTYVHTFQSLNMHWRFRLYNFYPTKCLAIAIIWRELLLPSQKSKFMYNCTVDRIATCNTCTRAILKYISETKKQKHRVQNCIVLFAGIWL